MFTLDTEIDALASLLTEQLPVPALICPDGVDFFKVGKIAQLNTVSHGQCMSSLLIKHCLVSHGQASSIDGASRLSLSVTAASYLTELALVVSRTEAAVKLEAASPVDRACP